LAKPLQILRQLAAVHRDFSAIHILIFDCRVTPRRIASLSNQYKLWWHIMSKSKTPAVSSGGFFILNRVTARVFLAKPATPHWFCA